MTLKDTLDIVLIFILLGIILTYVLERRNG